MLTLGLLATACAGRETDTQDDGAEGVETSTGTGEESGTSTTSTGDTGTSDTTTSGSSETTTETTDEDSSTTEWEPLPSSEDDPGPAPEWDCGNGEYIYEFEVCNEYPDCSNGHDESEEVCGSAETSGTDETTN